MKSPLSRAGLGLSLAAAFVVLTGCAGSEPEPISDDQDAQNVCTTFIQSRIGATEATFDSYQVESSNPEWTVTGSVNDEQFTCTVVIDRTAKTWSLKSLIVGGVDGMLPLELGK